MDKSPTQADWRRWLEDHAPKFLLFARQKARSEADAQDLVQEAVVEAWQRRDDGQPPPVAHPGMRGDGIGSRRGQHGGCAAGRERVRGPES